MVLNPIAQLNLVTILGVMIIFLVVHLVLRKTFFLSVIDAMQRREAKIEAGRKTLAEAARLVADAQEEAEKIRGAVAVDSEKAEAEVRARIEAARETRLAEANAEAETVLTAGREEVSALTESERAKMRNALTSCVAETLSKVMGAVDERAVRAMVDKELASREAAGTTE